MEIAEDEFEKKLDNKFKCVYENKLKWFTCLDKEIQKLIYKEFNIIQVKTETVNIFNVLENTEDFQYTKIYTINDKGESCSLKQ